MSEFGKQVKERYGNGQRYTTIFRLVELFGVAAVAGIIAMYGAASTMRGELRQLSTQVTEMAASIDRHIQNYNIHVPHGK